MFSVYKVTVYQSFDVVENANYVACIAILNHCMFRVEKIVDRDEVARRSKSVGNSPHTFCIVTFDGTTIFDFFRLINWISSHGLQRL